MSVVVWYSVIIGQHQSKCTDDDRLDYCRKIREHITQMPENGVIELTFDKSALFDMTWEKIDD